MDCIGAIHHPLVTHLQLYVLLCSAVRVAIRAVHSEQYCATSSVTRIYQRSATSIDTPSVEVRLRDYCACTPVFSEMDSKSEIFKKGPQQQCTGYYNILQVRAIMFQCHRTFGNRN